MTERAREKVGTADIGPLALAIAGTVFDHGSLIEKRKTPVLGRSAGKWRKEHGLGIGTNRTLMATMDGEFDLVKRFWAHSSRLELKIIGADKVKLKAVFKAPLFNELESFEVDGQSSMDLGALADALGKAKKLMAIDVQSTVEGTRGAVRRTTSQHPQA